VFVLITFREPLAQNDTERPIDNTVVVRDHDVSTDDAIVPTNRIPSLATGG